MGTQLPMTRARMANWAAGRSLRWRIFAAFVVLALLTAALGVVAAQSVARSGALVAEIFDRALIATSYARSAATGFAALEAMFAGTDDPPLPAGTIAAMAERAAEVQGDLAIAVERTGSTRAAAAGAMADQAVAAWMVAAAAPATGPDPMPQLAARARDGFELLVEHVAAEAFRLRQQAVAAIDAARWRTLIGTGLALLLGALVALLLARRIIRPVAAASRAAAGIAAGALETPIPPGGGDELGELLRAMARMRDAIRATIQGEQAERHAAEARLASAIESSSEGVVLTDASGRIAVANARAAALLPDAARKLRPGEAWAAAIAAVELGGGTMAAALASPPPCTIEAARADGGWLRIARSAARDGGVVAILSDITDLKRQQAALTETNRRFAAALDNMGQGLALFDADDRLLVANRQVGEMLRVDPAMLVPGRSWRDLIGAVVAVMGHPPADWPALVQDSMRFVARRTVGTRLRHTPDGRVYAVTVTPTADGGFVATWQDVTDRERAQARIAHMARHDALTGLPNRSLLRERLAALLGEGRHFAVHALDLDRFRELNDSLGTQVGDAVLAAVGQRLHELVGEDGLAARLSGDDFVVVLPDRDAAAAGVSAARIADVLNAPHDLGGEMVTVRVHLGHALAPVDGGAPDTLLRHATLACERAKADGAAESRRFHPDMDQALRTRRTLETELRRAIAEDSLEVHYQPLVDCQRGTVSGFEALLRWNHPTRGRIPPVEFIPVAEQSGLIVPLGEWVLRTATREATRWPGTPRVAVNVSPLQFRSARLADAVFEALEAAGLPATRLEIEITESTLVDDADAVLAVLNRLRETGIRVAMDDFGTGYSSLATLRAFPFEKIKIDQSFVRVPPAGQPQAEAIVRAVAGLAAALGMRCTAEGVETAEQFARLRAAGCTEVQGYFFGRPCPAAEVPALIAHIEARARIAA